MMLKSDNQKTRQDILKYTCDIKLCDCKDTISKCRNEIPTEDMTTCLGNNCHYIMYLCYYIIIYNNYKVNLIQYDSTLFPLLSEMRSMYNNWKLEALLVR